MRSEFLSTNKKTKDHQNPFIGALGIQEPVIPGEPLIKGLPMTWILMIFHKEM